MVEVLRKPVFILYYKEFVYYLTRNSGWLPAIFCLWNISSHGPRIISQHTGTPLALVPLFHGGNVRWNCCLCVSLTSPGFSWKKSKWESKKCTFKGILHAIMGFYKIRHHIMIVFCLMISPKIGSDFFLMISMLLFSTSLSWFSNYASCGFKILHPVLAILF
jgi:hypothetical protein